MEDDKVAILEAQLAQAKQIAEEADRKYEEVTWAKGEKSATVLCNSLQVQIVWTSHITPQKYFRNVI